MTATTQRAPYIWVTWITKLLAGDDHCQWAAWFRAHFKYAKRDDRSFDKAAWSSNHDSMVRARAEQLAADGWLVWIEDQNKFEITGRTGTRVSGKPDIVARRSLDVIVVDCKSGKPRHSDWWQVLEYMLFLPLYHPALKVGAGWRLRGEVQYPDHAVTVQPEEFTPALREKILTQIARTGGDGAPERVPSSRECGFCDIGPGDCPYRISTDTTEVTSDLF